MSIREQKKGYESHQTKNTLVGSKLPGAAEDLCSEIYNPGSETITFENIHPWRARMCFHGLPSSYWMRLECKPGEWLFLPHAMYKGSVPSGRPITVIQNFGDSMFVGNKLPSRPEASKVRSFVPGLRS